MNRVISVLVFLVVLFQGSQVMAMDQGTPEYAKMKEYKKAQREKAKTGPAEKNFWQKEAERSGLAGTFAAATNMVSNAVPLDKPNSRK